MKFGLIGKNLSYSYSQIIHNELGNNSYELKQLEPSDLEEFLSCKDFKGINITNPYKKDVIPFLNKIDNKAKEIGVVNTITNIGGKLIGFNSDYYGFKLLIKHFNIDAKNKNVLILGTGGTSETVKRVFQDSEAKEIIKVGRNGKGDISYEEINIYFDWAEIIVNTTPVGTSPNFSKSVISLEMFNSLTCVIDVVYNPLTTDLIRQAREKGIQAYSGLYMLVAQAVYSDSFFFNIKPKVKEIDRIYNKLLKNKLNIVLIGMPGSGKTSFGKYIAKELNRKFIDIDGEIEKNENQPVSEIFKTEGEEYFRKLEINTISSLEQEKRCVISTGGGCILNEVNINSLKRNGIIFFINRDIKNLKINSSRPLAQNANDLEKLFTERKDLYIKYADIIIDNNDSPLSAIQEIIRRFYEEDFNY